MLEEYLSEKQKRKKERERKFFLAGVVVIIVLVNIAVLWFFLRSPFFRVRSIVVQGSHTVASGDIVELFEGSILKNHGFLRSLLGIDSMFIWPDSLAPSDIALISELKGVSVTKNYLTGTILITVTERQPFAIWCTMPKADVLGNPAGDEMCYWFDNDGVAFEKAFDTEGNAIFAVHDYSDTNVTLEQQVLPEPLISNLISVIGVLRESAINVKEIALQDMGLQEIDILTYNGPTLEFSLRFPADQDLSVLEGLMAKPGFDNLQYVDFRVQNRAYYK